MILKILLGVFLALLFFILLISFVCFTKVFYVPKRKPLGADEYDLPKGKVYEPYYDDMIGWTKELRAMPREEVELTTRDGLTLRGAYYEYRKGAPVEILFHGYRGNSERDLCCGVQRCFAIGRNALLVDQRGAGKSDGHVVTFGVRERKDCLQWIDFALEKFGKDVKIVLTGISMGAATVLAAAGEPLPENVVCVLADCPYSSAKAIIGKIVREMRLPPKLVYPFIRLGARLFGSFDLEEAPPIEAAKRCKTPVILIHGDEDAFVPCSMSEELYAACAAPKKKLVFINGAGHGLAYPKDEEGYLRALREFQTECGF